MPDRRIAAPIATPCSLRRWGASFDLTIDPAPTSYTGAGKVSSGLPNNTRAPTFSFAGQHKNHVLSASNGSSARPPRKSLRLMNPPAQSIENRSPLDSLMIALFTIFAAESQVDEIGRASCRERGEMSVVA